MYHDHIRRTNGDTSKASEVTISASGLSKQYDDLWALRDLDLEVRSGTVLGLLGHNGAGKTTAIRLLTTLSQPTEGSATVAGHDVVADPGAVRSSIGVAAQAATVDGLLTGRANLEMIGRLYQLSKAEAAKRAEDLLARLSLTDAGDRLVKNYSGGMRRRLDLAASLIGDPPVIFLDEPTTGLDPAARRELWDLIRELVDDGRTVLLTTQYLEEADELADRIVVLDHGRAVAEGTPAELKAEIGGERLDVIVSGAAELEPAARALAAYADGEPAPDAEAKRLTLPVRQGTTLIEIARALDDAGVEAIDVHRREATLDDVFLSLTGNGRDADAGIQTTETEKEAVR
jgi:ABC-2 type transport system ATP-binding protein